ncbi:MAG: hypothetical protein RLZZ535_193 [Cyanobacteriota bacterium]
MTNSTYGVVLVTVASLAEGKAIATKLIEDKLAACVNLFPLDSIYLCSLLTAHCSLLNALPIIAGSKTYLDWLGASLQS